MQTVIDDFADRKTEINKYFEFLEKLEKDYLILMPIDNSLPVYNIDGEHIKIFRANGFLILYNLIESTITNCIISIFDEIYSRRINNKVISYSDLTDKIKKYWIKNKYKHDPAFKSSAIVNQFYEICELVTDILPLILTKDRFDFGGNLTALKIKETAESLGVSLNMPHFKTYLHGEVFKKIKDYRNELAHGDRSFTKIGNDVSYIGDGNDGIRGLGLIHFKNYTIEHLESFIDNIMDFIRNERYLLTSAI